jgi:hypothetical protein
LMFPPQTPMFGVQIRNLYVLNRLTINNSTALPA